MKNLVECLKTKLGQNNYLSLTLSDFEIFLILKIRVYTNSLAFVYWGVFTVEIDAYRNVALKYF